ncbi:MAG: helix-turn-helix transcriptional regulator [Pyrinomonadaceae bacterium]
MLRMHYRAYKPYNQANPILPNYILQSSIRRYLLMGHAPREKVLRLPEKLLQIRQHLQLSQNGIIRHLNLEDKLTREDISKFERAIREPSLPTLLRYARAIGTSTDVLIDDKIDLPFVDNEKYK